jgi:hypothetical protein
MKSSTSTSFLSRHKFLLSAVIIIILIVLSALIYRVFFSKPYGQYQKDYNDFLYIYETIMTAFEEERPLSSFEQSKIESMLNDYDKRYDEIINSDLTVDEVKDFEEITNIYFNVLSMYERYVHATQDIWDDYERKEYLSDFLEEQKVAKESLGLK